MGVIHTKKVAYYLLGAGAIALSLVFSYRTAILYYVLFSQIVEWYWAFGLSGIAFLGIAVAEFVSSIQWSGSGAKNWIVIIIVLLNDGAGSIYTVMGTKATSENPNFSFVNLVLIIGLTAMTLLPFVFGSWMHTIAPQIDAEESQRHNDWVNNYGRILEKRAARQYQNEAIRDPEILKRFAPTQIIEYFERASVLQIEAPRNEKQSMSIAPINDIHSTTSVHENVTDEMEISEQKNNNVEVMDGEVEVPLAQGALDLRGMIFDFLQWVQTPR